MQSVNTSLDVRYSHPNSKIWLSWSEFSVMVTMTTLCYIAFSLIYCCNGL